MEREYEALTMEIAQERCVTCGEPLEAVLGLSFGAPLQYEDLPYDERATRATLTDDTCTIDDRHFFVRGCLEVPVLDRDDRFVWGVWVALSRPNYRRFLDWLARGGEAELPPNCGRLCNRIPGYPETLLLRTNLHLRPLPDRPAIELAPSAHPLSVHQRLGIEPAELGRILHENLHRSGHPGPPTRASHGQ